MRMGHEVGGQMTMTAHRALFTLKDPRAKKALARRAASEGWKSKRVEEEVRSMTRPTTGRPRDHVIDAFVKKVERATRPLLDAATVGALTEAEATDEQLLWFATRLEHRAVLMEALATRFRRRVGRD